MSADRDASARSELGFILSLAGWRRLALLGLAMTGVALTEGIGLVMLVPIAQSVTGDGPAWLGGTLRFLPLAMLLAIFVALVAARAVLAYANQNLQRDIGIDGVRRLRSMLRDAIMQAEWRWLTAQSGADHAALIMGMAEKIGHLAVQLMQMAAALITLVILVGTAALLSWRLTALILLLGIGVVGATFLLRTRPMREGAAYSGAYARLQGVLQQGIAHLRAARIAGAGDSVRAEFDDLAGEVGRIESHYGRRLTGVNMIFQVLAAAALALVVWLGVTVLATPVVLLVPILVIFARAVPLSNTVQQSVRTWQFARPAIGEMQRLVADARKYAEPPGDDADIPRLDRELVLHDVTVRFAGRETPIIDGLDLSIAAGSIVAVVGPSGSGKSTLADLVSGLLEPDGGTITLDGLALSGDRRIAWRRNVAYVEQTPYLFDDTVRANLGWGHQGLPDQRLDAALRAASAGFVFDLPQGVDTLVGEGGRQLSGGERQRIALARALLREPDLLLLDETTSSLDQRSEDLVVDSIRKLKGTCTIVILGHRPGMTALADKVVELALDRASR